MTAGDVFPFLAGKGAVVDVENHGQRRFVDVDFRQSFRVLRVRNGFADLEVRDADDAGDFAHSGFILFDTFQAFIGIDAANLSFALAFAVSDDDSLVRIHLAADNTADSDFTDIIIVVQGRDHELQRAFSVAFRARAVFDDGLEQRFEVVAVVIHGVFSNAVTAVCIDDREIELFVRSVEFHEQFEYFVFDFSDTGTGFVDLVDDDDRFQFLFQSLAQNVFRLRHRAFKSIDEEQYAVYHVQYTFYFAAEVSMPRGVDDVDLDAFVHDRCIFGQDCNAAFTFNIPRVHDTFFDFFVRTENMALFEHGIDQCRFAMVDVGNNCNITNIFAFHLMSSLSLTNIRLYITRLV